MQTNTMPFTIPFTYEDIRPAYTKVGRSFVKGSDVLHVVTDNGVHAIIEHFDGTYHVIENISDKALHTLTETTLPTSKRMSRLGMLKIMSDAGFRYVIENDIPYVTTDGTEVLALYNQTFTTDEAQTAMIQVWDKEGNTFETSVTSLQMIQ